MGLGGGPGEWEDYEWVRLADLPPAAATADGPAGTPVHTAYAPMLEHLWQPGAGPRVLLVDLDNLRAGPVRWRQRMAMVVSMAREAGHAVLAGQEGAVRRGRPYLAEFADAAVQVADGSDLADHVLLDAADRVRGHGVQFVVLSNDGIFATLADRGPLTVLSPGADALSERLRSAATRVVDLAALEGITAGPRRPEFRATRRAPAARRPRRRRTPATT
jgi:hypothetical protein